MVGTTPMTNLLDLPSYTSVEQKLSPSPKQAGGRKQPPVDSVCVCVGGETTQQQLSIITFARRPH